MSIRKGIQAGYDFPSLTLRQHGLGALQQYEREDLALTLVKELRKGSFVVPSGSDDDIRRSFADHVQEHFADNEQLQVVIDYQPRLLYSARNLSRRPHPIESVILYATWTEHWVNAILLTTALKRGTSEKDAVQMVRDATFRAKLGWLWMMLGLPPIPEPHLSRVQLLADIRNEHVHYKWKGQEPDVLYDPARERLTLAVTSISDTVAALVEFELTALLGQEIALADRLFNVCLAPTLRAQVLEWTPPESPEWRDT
jgi:hypothetical protein